MDPQIPFLSSEGVVVTVILLASVSIIYRFLDHNFGFTRLVEEGGALRKSVLFHGTYTYFGEIMTYTQGIGPEGHSEVIPCTIFHTYVPFPFSDDELPLPGIYTQRLYVPSAFRFG